MRDKDQSRREVRLLLLLPLLVVTCWWCYFFFHTISGQAQTYRRAAAVWKGSRVWPSTPTGAISAVNVLLVTALPQCANPNGQFLLTKALQSKLAFARAQRWSIVPVSGVEMAAAAASTLLQTDELASSTVGWPALLQQTLAAAAQGNRQHDWLVWMGPELLVLAPAAFQLPEPPETVDIVLLRAQTPTTPSAAEMAAATESDQAGQHAADSSHHAGGALPPLDLSVAFVRGSKSAQELLSAWSDAIAAAGADTSASVANQLSLLLRTRVGWRERVLVESHSTSAGWLQGLQSAPLSRPPAVAASVTHGRRSWLASFQACNLCSPAAGERSRSTDDGGDNGLGNDDETRRAGGVPSSSSSSLSPPSAACSAADVMQAFTEADDVLSLRALGAEHAAAGSIHVRPMAVDGRTGGGWLQRHRGTLGRCLPSLLIVGAQRSSLGSVHWALRRGWHSQIRVNEGGDRDIHFFSMDNRYRLGLASHARRFPSSLLARNGTGGALGVCGLTQPADGVLAEVSSSYLDYPKAPPRIAAVLPHARIVVVLREPVSRALSAFNFRWLTWLCGKLVWARPDCWAGVTSEQAIKAAQVGPFQVRAALKLWRACSTGGTGAPSLRCLQQDYVGKLRNKTATELATLRACAARAERHDTPASVDWVGCLKLRSVMLGPKQVHKVLEDSSFVWRSMFAAHLRSWLRLYPANQLLVVDPSALLAPEHAPSAMRRLATFAGVPVGGATDMGGGAAVTVRDDLLQKPSPGAVELGLRAGIHENARRCVLGRRAPPADVVRSMTTWLRPHNCDLAGLLTRHGLLTRAALEQDGDAASMLPWLKAELLEAATGEGRGCAGVKSVNEWFVGAS